MRTSVKRNPAPQQPEPQEPKSPPIPLESLEDIAWELWLLIELLAPERRRLPNTASQKLVDYLKDRLITKSVALAEWKKARPELFPDSPIGALDVLPGENWIFPEHRTLADVIEAEQTSARGTLEGFLIRSARFHVLREAIPIVFLSPLNCVKRTPPNVFTISIP